MDALIGVRNQIQSLTRLYNRQAAELLARLMAGAEIESGTHTAFIEEESCGPLRTVKLSLS